MLLHINDWAFNKNDCYNLIKVKCMEKEHLSINHNKIRPIYINLFLIRLPVSAISSITHRLAGIYIFFVTLPLSLYLYIFQLIAIMIL